MPRLLLVAFALLLTGCASRPTPVWQTPVGSDQLAKRGEAWRWTFDEPGSGPFVGTLPFEPPTRFFYEVLGRWSPVADPSAPSAPNVFRQTEPLKETDSPRVVVGSLVFSDLVAGVSCRPSCGLIVRAQDADDYELARWDASRGVVEDAVRRARRFRRSRGRRRVRPAPRQWC